MEFRVSVVYAIICLGAAVTIDAVVKNGYHWTGWTGTYETDRKQYAFAMPVQNVRMTANAQINHSTLKVDPNGEHGRKYRCAEFYGALWNG